MKTEIQNRIPSDFVMTREMGYNVLNAARVTQKMIDKYGITFPKKPLQEGCDDESL